MLRMVKYMNYWVEEKISTKAVTLLENHAKHTL